MTKTVFHSLCAAMGYEAETVLSVRVNPSEVVVTAFDAGGSLRTTKQRHSGRVIEAWDGLPETEMPPADSCQETA